MAEPALTRRPPDLAQALMREGQEALQRAEALFQFGGDRVVIAQELHAAGMSFIEAGREMAAQERERRARASAPMRWVP